MKLHTIVITVTELQDALRDFAEKYTKTQPGIVVVDNGYGKAVLTVPLDPGAVVRGEDFMRKTEVV